MGMTAEKTWEEMMEESAADETTENAQAATASETTENTKEESN